MDKEQQFLEEMKPLLQDYVEYTKEDMSKKWEDMEKEALAKVEESQARLDEAKKRQEEATKIGEIFDEVMLKLQTTGGKSYKAVEDDRKANLDRLEEYGREYNQREKELAKANEEVEQVKARIEQEKQERIEKQKEKQESIYEKAKEYIASSKEEMEKEIKEKEDKLKALKEQRRKLESEKKTALKLKSKLENESKEVKNTEIYKKIYTVANEESKKSIEALKEHSKAISQATEELEGAQATLVSFKEKYDAIDFTTEAGIQSLIEITEWEEENVMIEEQENDTQQQDINEGIEPEGEEKVHKLTEDEVEVKEDDKTKRDLSKEEIDKILTDENVEEVEAPKEEPTQEQEETPTEEPEQEQHEMSEEEKWQVIKAIYEEREKGREDLLSPDYLVLKYQNLAMKDVDEAMKIALTTKGKSLLEIYEECLGNLEKKHPHFIELEELIDKVKDREEELLMTESKEGELSPAEIASLKAKNGEKECLIAALELMYRKVERNFEDLLIPQYIQIRRTEMDKASDAYTTEEQVKEKLLAMANKTLKDICSEQLEIAKQEKDEKKFRGLTGMIKGVKKREKFLRKSNEQTSTEKNPASQTPAGQKPASQTPVGQNPASQTPTAQNPIEQQSGQGKSGMSQILQSNQGAQAEMPISRIETDTNKGKVIVYFDDRKTKEYSMRDILLDRSTILLNVERSVKSADIFNERTSKQRETIIEAANIFVLKALYDYKIKQGNGQILEDYLKNIDIVNSITRSSDMEQMPIPKIIHIVNGRILTKGEYNKTLRQVNKDKDLDNVGIIGMDEKTKIPKTFGEKLAILKRPFEWMKQKHQRKIEMTYEERKEKEEQKAREKQEKEETKARNKRERRLAKDKEKTAAKQEREEMKRRSPRENLGMEYVDVEHEKAMRDAELVSEDEMKRMKEMMDQMQQ